MQECWKSPPKANFGLCHRGFHFFFRPAADLPTQPPVWHSNAETPLVGKVCLSLCYIGLFQLAWCWCWCDRQSFAKLLRRYCSMMNKGGWLWSICLKWVSSRFCCQYMDTLLIRCLVVVSIMTDTPSRSWLVLHLAIWVSKAVSADPIALGGTVFWVGTVCQANSWKHFGINPMVRCLSCLSWEYHCELNNTS